LKLKTSSLLIAGALFGAAVLPAQANNEAMMDLLKVLRDQGTITAENYELLTNAAKADKESADATEAKVEKVAKKADDATIVSLKGGHLKVKSGDGDFSAQIGGRVMADYAVIDDDRDLDGNGSEIRRARIFLKGKAFNDWGYKAQVDFASDEVTIKDMFIAYNGFENLQLTLGNHKISNGLEANTSSKYITFMERSTIDDVFSVGRKNGLSLATGGDNWSFKTGLHMDGIDNDNNDKDEDYGYGARATFAPINDKTRLIHLGVSAHHQEFEDNFSNGAYSQQRFRARPEIHMINTRPYDTRIDGVEDSNTYGLEAAAVYGPFSAQAEYFKKDVNTDTSDVDFNGWYVYGSYFLTGESRPYKAKHGVFSRVKPKSVVGQGGMGAWELAVRYSDIDLYDGSGPAVNTLGEEGDVTTLGVNWYATSNIRLMANYVMSTVEYKGTAKSDDDIDAFQVRGQIDF
jgi:phosphate-selective porin OprO and OprP